MRRNTVGAQGEKETKKTYYPISCATAGLSVTVSGTNPDPGQFATALMDEAKKNLAGSARGEESARSIRFTAPRTCASKLLPG